MDKTNEQELQEYRARVEESKKRAQELNKKIEEGAKWFNEHFPDIKPYPLEEKEHKSK